MRLLAALARSIKIGRVPQVDPVDDATFWYTQEYTLAGGQWRTRVVSFGGALIFADGFESGDTSAWSTTVP